MSNAFQISEDDVMTVLYGMGRRCDEETAARILAVIDAAAVEKAALYGDDLVQQTEYAHEEIGRQLQARSAQLDAQGVVAVAGLAGDGPHADRPRS